MKRAAPKREGKQPPIEDLIARLDNAYPKNPPLRTLRFRCPACDRSFATVDEMLTCFKQPVEHGPFRVGQIVMCSNEWQGVAVDPNDPWLACIRKADPKSNDHFDRIDQYWPWFVITSLWHKEHREVCSLVSLMGNEIRAGWNPTVETTHHVIWPAGEIADWEHTKGWPEHFQNDRIIPISDTLRQQAAQIAALGHVTTNLI